MAGDGQKIYFWSVKYELNWYLALQAQPSQAFVCSFSPQLPVGSRAPIWWTLSHRPCGATIQTKPLVSAQWQEEKISHHHAKLLRVANCYSNEFTLSTLDVGLALEREAVCVSDMTEVFTLWHELTLVKHYEVKSWKFWCSSNLSSNTSLCHLGTTCQFFWKQFLTGPIKTYE